MVCNFTHFLIKLLDPRKAHASFRNLSLRRERVNRADRANKPLLLPAEFLHQKLRVVDVIFDATNKVVHSGLDKNNVLRPGVGGYIQKRTVKMERVQRTCSASPQHAMPASCCEEAHKLCGRAPLVCPLFANAAKVSKPVITIEKMGVHTV